MRKISAFLIVVFASIQLQAQDFQGMAVYESKTNTADVKSRLEGNKEITPDMQKMIEDRMKQMFEKTFILNFSKTTSIYKEEEKLDAPGSQSNPGFKMMGSMMGGGGTYFKNTKEKNYIVDKEFMGKEFLIKDSLPKLTWKMESETKQIGGYTCYKATAIVPVSQSDFRNLRQKAEKTEADKKETPKAADGKTTNLMEDFEMPKTMTITAWYTPDIPVSQGPESYWGLPGLILETNDGKTTILCSKIVLNAKEKVMIKAPTTGEVITQKKYDETVTKKIEELKQMQGRNGSMMPMRRP